MFFAGTPHDCLPSVDGLPIATTDSDGSITSSDHEELIHRCGMATDDATCRHVKHSDGNLLAADEGLSGNADTAVCVYRLPG